MTAKVVGRGENWDLNSGTPLENIALSAELRDIAKHHLDKNLISLSVTATEEKQEDVPRLPKCPDLL